MAQSDAKIIDPWLLHEAEDKESSLVSGDESTENYCSLSDNKLQTRLDTVLLWHIERHCVCSLPQIYSWSIFDKSMILF